MVWIRELPDWKMLSLCPCWSRKTLNMNVKDAVTGLDRFKSGYIVDGFNDHSRGDVNSPTIVVLLMPSVHF